MIKGERTEQHDDLAKAALVAELETTGHATLDMPQSLTGHAVRGGIVIGSAQLVRIGVQFLSVIVLSRLLLPEDFGLVASVTPLVGLCFDVSGPWIWTGHNPASRHHAGTDLVRLLDDGGAGFELRAVSNSGQPRGGLVFSRQKTSADHNCSERTALPRQSHVRPQWIAQQAPQFPWACNIGRSWRCLRSSMRNRGCISWRTLLVVHDFI